MELLHLKAPPDRVALMADAIERDILRNSWDDDPRELQEVLTWLRYRLAKWKAAHPDSPAA